MNEYVGITIKVNQDFQELVMASLYELGYEAFVENESDLQAFIPETSWNEQIKSETSEKLKSFGLDFDEEHYENQDWNAQWESNFKDILIGDKLQVRAVFHETNPEVMEEIIIAPKMAFGTGHHATTSMILEWMMDQKMNGMKVLDFGCGTGILGIYALKKSAAYLALVDIEPEAIENSIENLELNSLNANWIKEGSIEAIPDIQFDIILANITRNILTELMDDLLLKLSKQGTMIISGFLEQDKVFMEEFCKSKNLQVVKVIQQLDWIAMVLKFI
ncbi:MAG: 50S ribosomal protein L11 methyltransferase [Saprospiraceae bacterium]|nr:50S ribosomal protein L11 methyltransferase [Saprospiraceae bacterium]